MQFQDASTPLAADAPAAMGLLAAAELQDHLMVASNDLDRLQRLLGDAAGALMQHFTFATECIDEGLHADGSPGQAARAARSSLAAAITALQFQDMAQQLIAHTTRRLRNCADRLAQEALADDEDGAAVIEPMPLKPNPVTQDEMDAGSIELF